MNKYKVYQPLSNRVERTMRKNKLIDVKKKERKNKSIREAIKYVLTEVPDLGGTMDLPIMMEEHYWSKHPTVIFPESSEILDRLVKSSFSIKNPDKLFTEQESFMLAMPKDFKINGKPACAVLVTISNFTQHRFKLYDSFFDWVNMPMPGINHHFDENEWSVALNYKIDGESDDMYYRSVIPATKMADLLASDPHDYQSILGTFPEVDTHRGTSFALDAEHGAFQQTLFRLILAVVIYKKTVKNSLIEGYPGENRPVYEEIYSPAYKDYSLGMPHLNEQHSPKEHYRSWYFRQLNHDKYYQGVYADVPKGSRIVFVKDTMVGTEVHAKTLIDRKAG